MRIQGRARASLALRECATGHARRDRLASWLRCADAAAGASIFCAIKLYVDAIFVLDAIGIPIARMRLDALRVVLAFEDSYKLQIPFLSSYTLLQAFFLRYT